MAWSESFEARISRELRVAWYTPSMTPKLTPEMRNALAARPGQPIEVEDEQTHRVYLLVERDQAREQLDRWIIDQLAAAEEDVAAGRVAEWDKQAFLDRSGIHPSAG